MMRIMFCMSVAIFAILPPLFAIMDDGEYVYVDDDVSNWWNIKIMTGHFRLIYQPQLKVAALWPSHQLLQPLPETQIATVVSSEFEIIQLNNRGKVLVEGE